MEELHKSLFPFIGMFCVSLSLHLFQTVCVGMFPAGVFCFFFCHFPFAPSLFPFLMFNTQYCFHCKFFCRYLYSHTLSKTPATNENPMWVSVWCPNNKEIEIRLHLNPKRHGYFLFVHVFVFWRGVGGIVRCGLGHIWPHRICSVKC